MQISALIMAMNERENLLLLLPALHKVLTELVGKTEYEIVIVDGGSKDRTVEDAREMGARVIQQKKRGYGNALREGIEAVLGEYILTVDADLSHEPVYIKSLWQERTTAEVIIASRYVTGGSADMPEDRRILSLILNLIFGRVLSLNINDMSSGFRLYQAQVIKDMPLHGVNFDILLEIILRAYAEGWKIKEIPFHYTPRQHGNSKARLLKFGVAYLKMLLELWKIRNSIDSADYDRRAFHSWIIFQRYWQRRRHQIIIRWAKEFLTQNEIILDIGCGSSQILVDLNNVVGLDIRQNKLRFMRQFDKALVNGTIFALPFGDDTFDCVICSQVIEHIPYDEILFKEFQRVLRPGGTLILGTPDYASWQWVLIESIYKYAIPGGYADEHITHYTHQSLKALVKRYEFEYLETDSILNAEIILCCKKKI